MPIKLKSGVSLLGIQPQIVLAILIAESCFQGQTMTVTSVTDHAVGRSKSSRHKSGLAFDLRTYNLQSPELTAESIRDSLGNEFDVVLESDHIHVEWDPKS